MQTRTFNPASFVQNARERDAQNTPSSPSHTTFAQQVRAVRQNVTAITRVAYAISSYMMTQVRNAVGSMLSGVFHTMSAPSNTRRDIASPVSEASVERQASLKAQKSADDLNDLPSHYQDIDDFAEKADIALTAYGLINEMPSEADAAAKPYRPLVVNGDMYAKVNKAQKKSAATSVDGMNNQHINTCPAEHQAPEADLSSLNAYLTHRELNLNSVRAHREPIYMDISELK